MLAFCKKKFKSSKITKLVAKCIHGRYTSLPVAIDGKNLFLPNLAAGKTCKAVISRCAGPHVNGKK